ncbi:DUF4239 domain-containing protein [Actinocorallia sp. API 0066]|uniref:bestrophin-like domain n=1 Tax=Actinocorallia sp. API 0066 TaxID=2896846 RepID=UPI001E3E5645|nr:DUF4239 domain-containing protein [Actinocorallia sp. API 0066]MCD0451419.1 DUF4239 domain-containing protein [Actinocorallia sp. API 0066]
MVIGSVVCAVLAVGLVLAAARLLARRGERDDATDGPTAGHAGSMMSALFLLVFAIAVIVPWTAADAARQNTQAEAQALVEAYWAAGELSPEARAQVRQGVRAYTGFVIKDEWPVMRAESRLAEEGWTRLDEFRARVNTLIAPDATHQAALEEVRDQMQDVYAARRQRAADVESTLPAGVLVFTVLTGLAMIVLPFLVGAAPRGRALLPLALMAAMLGVGMFLVFDIDHVFAGSLGVDPTAFETAVAEFDRIPWQG